MAWLAETHSIVLDVPERVDSTRGAIIRSPRPACMGTISPGPGTKPRVSLLTAQIQPSIRTKTETTVDDRWERRSELRNVPR